LNGTFGRPKVALPRASLREKTAGQGFARPGAGAPWRGKNKDPFRLKLASEIWSVCFYTLPPARHRRNHLPHNSKAGFIVFYFKVLLTNNMYLSLLQYYL